MQLGITPVLCLFAAITLTFAAPSPEDYGLCNSRRALSSSKTSSRSTTKSTTTTPAKVPAASSFVSAICTSPAAHFPPVALTLASQFCTAFLNLKTSTVKVTVTSTTSGTASIVTVKVTNTVTITPSTTVTIPFTITQPGLTETQTASASTVSSIVTNSVTTRVTVTSFTSTVTETKIDFVTYRKRQNRGILGNYADSIISTACKCLAKSPPTKTITMTISTGTNPITSPAASTSTFTVVVTSELEEFTRSIFTTILFPGEDETITVTPTPVTVISNTVVTVTTTDTVNSVTTTTTRINARPTNSYSLVYSGNTCCFRGYSLTKTYTDTKDRSILATDCQARCDANPDCKLISLEHVVSGTFDAYVCLMSYVDYTTYLVDETCDYSAGCQVFDRV